MSRFDDAELDFYTITLPALVGSWLGWGRDDDPQLPFGEENEDTDNTYIEF